MGIVPRNNLIIRIGIACWAMLILLFLTVIALAAARPLRRGSQWAEIISAISSLLYPSAERISSL